jgi:UDP-glucose 4-epimerase
MTVDQGSWSGRRVLITGGSGFIGLNLAARLRVEGADVSLLARRPRESGRGPRAVEGARVILGDVQDAASVGRAFATARPEVVFHLASTPFNPPGTTDREHHDVIVGGTANVVAEMRPNMRLVHAGSGAEYGSGSALTEDAPLRPTTGLGVAKAEATTFIRERARSLGLDAVVLRLFTPYGPWDHAGRLVMHSALRAREGADIQITDGRQQRDFVYIDDVVEAFILAARLGAAGSVFNVSSGSPKTVREVAELVLELTGRGGSVIARALPTRPDEIWELSGDSTAAEATLGWRPTVTFRDGVGRTCVWVEEHHGLLEEPLEVRR